MNRTVVSEEVLTKFLFVLFPKILKVDYDHRNSLDFRLFVLEHASVIQRPPGICEVEHLNHRDFVDLSHPRKVFPFNHFP